MTKRRKPDVPYSILPEQRIPLGNPKPTRRPELGTEVIIARPPWDKTRRKHIGKKGTIVDFKGHYPIIELASGERICADEHFWKRASETTLSPEEIVARVKKKVSADRLTKVAADE